MNDAEDLPEELEFLRKAPAVRLPRGGGGGCLFFFSVETTVTTPTHTTFLRKHDQGVRTTINPCLRRAHGLSGD